MLLLLQLDLSMCADLDDADAAREFRKTLLQLLAIPIGISDIDLATDLTDTSFDRLAITSTIDDGGRILGDDNAASATEHVE